VAHALAVRHHLAAARWWKSNGKGSRLPPFQREREQPGGETMGHDRTALMESRCRDKAALNVAADQRPRQVRAHNSRRVDLLNRVFKGFRQEFPIDSEPETAFVRGVPFFEGRGVRDSGLSSPKNTQKAEDWSPQSCFFLFRYT
jgi:hypothetical protein